MRHLFIFLFLNVLLLNAQQLDSVNNLLSHSKNDLEKANLLIQKARLVSQTNVNEARVLFFKAIAFAEKNKFHLQQVQANIALGRFYVKLNQYDSAKTVYTTGLEICIENKIEKEKISCVGEIGSVYYIQSNYLDALKQFHRALDLLKENKNDTIKANLFNNIANIYYQLGEFPKALDSFEQSLAIKIQLGDELSMANTYNNIANVYAELGDLKKALYHYNKSLEIIKIKGLTIQLAGAYANIAAVYRETGDYEKALFHAFEALKIDSAAKDLYGVAADYNEIAFSYKGQRKFSKAELYLNKSLKIVKEINAKDLEINLLADFSETYSEMKKYDKALLFYKKYAALKDSVFTEIKNKQIVEADKKYETAEKNAKIQTLILTNLENENQKKIFILISISLLVIAFLLLLFYRLRNKSNKILMQKNQELNKLNKIKTRLLRIISHDFKAPVSAFYSITNSLQQNIDKYEPHERHEILDRMLNASLSLKLQLNNLLSWAITQKEDLDVTFSEINLHTLVYKNIFVLEEFAKQREVKVLNNIPENFEINSNAQMLSIVLNNLLVNALKFSNKNSKVEFNAVKTDSLMQLILKDYGIGMNEEQIKNLFLETQISHDDKNNLNKGTNQGLLISKEIINKLGGNMIVKSQLSVGTEIIINFKNQ